MLLAALLFWIASVPVYVILLGALMGLWASFGQRGKIEQAELANRILMERGPGTPSGEIR